MKDSEIVDLYFLRDEEAIRMTETKYGAMLQQIAFRILGCWEDAEECVNDAYFEAWRRIPPNDPRNYLKAFLG